MEENKKNMEAINGKLEKSLNFIVSGLNTDCPLINLAGLLNECLGCL
jgi:hypothetical protein